MKKLLKGSMLSSGIALGIMASNGAIAQGACSVDFKTNSWGSSGQSSVTLTNNGAASSGWELCWTYSGDEKITNLWDGTVSQNGKNVCVKNPSYSQNIAAGGSVTFGFLVNSPGTAPTSFTFNGASCGGTGTPPPASSSVATITPSSSSAPSSAPVSNNAPAWVLDATGSSLTFVTVKKSAAGVETPEHMKFTQMRGTVSASGQAVLTIPLDSITDGGNITREGRMKSGLFETSHLPNLHFTTQLNLADINLIPLGDTVVKPVTGTLILHGISRSITFDAVITKNTDRIVTVSPRKPIVIDSVNYDMSGGVAWLQAQAGLAAIGERVPVYFKLLLSKDNPNNVAPLTLAAAPSTPLGLTGTTVSNGVSLNWVDSSNNETGFLVRRKGPDGHWKTASNSPANTQSYLDALTDSGSYDYKIISYRESIPSAPTAALTVAFTSGNVSTSSSSRSSAGNGGGNSSSSAGGNNGGTFPGNEAMGDTLFNTAGCTACHKDNDGDGRFTDGGVPFDVNDWQHPTRPNFVSGNYTGNSVQELARFINERMIGAFAECSAANCGEHIAAYLWSLRGRDQDDGVSCDNSSPVNYGIRSVKLLTSFEYHNSLQALFNRQLTKNYGTKELANPDRFVASLPNHTAETVTESRILSYKQNAEEIAAWAITNNAHGLSCSNTTSNECVNSFLDNFAYLAFRRPLTTEERTEYSAIVRSGPNGLRWAIQTVLMSPQFLYRTELGIPVSQARSQSWGNNNATVRAADGSAYVLDPYEYAAALAYMYTGSSPDRTLLSAAANGSLENANSLSQQIDRLLDSDLGKAQIGRFAGLWFRTDDVVNMTRNSTALTQAVKESMAQEIREIYKHAFYNNLPFTDIYTGEYTVLNSTLSQYYGLSGGGTSATDWRVVNTANSKRGGVLASGAFMTVNAHAGRTGPIKRAVHVRQDVLCQNIPLPTSFVDNTGLRDKAAAEAQVALEAGNLTTTRFYDMQTAVEGTPCYQCHNAIINPLFAVDDFDHLGNPRRVVNGKVVQKAMDLKGDEARSNDVEVDMVNLGGVLYGANGVGTVGFDEVNQEKNSGRPGLPFTGSKDLGRVMVANELPGVNACLIQKSFRFATGFALSREFQDDTLETPLTPAQQSQFACVVDTLESRLEAANGNPRAMLKELGMSNVVRFRR